MKKIPLLIGLVLIIASQLSAQKSPVFSQDGSAIHGYDAVSYFKEGKAVKGSDEFSLKWNGTKWNFSTPENLANFKSNPEMYAPQYGGYCAYGMFKGHKATTDPNAWTIVDGKLYLNHDLKVLELWRDKKEEKIMIADKNWPEIKNKE